MALEKRSFEGGINGDISQRLLLSTEMLNLMNARLGITEFGRDGRVENVPGTTAITQSVFPPYGTHQTIGAVPDDDRNRIIFFNFNSLSYHGIYCLDYSVPTVPVVYAILYDSQVATGLNFSKTSRIDRNAKVVGDMLYWTDNLNQPRRLNIEAGIKMNHPSYSTTVSPYSYPMNESVLTLIRRPFGLPVTVAKSTDGGFSENFISLFAGQFASRLVYRDGEGSVISTPSSMINYNLPSGTENYIQTAFPLSEIFEQDVQVVQLMVRYGNDPNYFIIREWNKDNASDLAEINAHNAGSTSLSYDFYNNETGIAVSNEDSVKPSDNIGTLVKTLEIADNRLFLSNYTKGYNTPVITSLSGTATPVGSNPPTAISCKSYGSLQVAIRFRDNYKRSSFAVTNTDCLVSFPDRTFAAVPYNNLTWSVSNANALVEIPDWATYYDILVTKNLRTRFFLAAFGNNKYAKKLNDGTYSYQTNYDTGVYASVITISGISDLLGLGYLFQEGTEDLCRLYLGNTATVYELKIIGQDGDNLLLKPINLGNFSTQPGCWFEIYTPYKPSDNEAFYTTGNSFTISNAGTGARAYSTLTGTIEGDVVRVYDTGFLSLRYEVMSPNYNKGYDWFQIYGETVGQSLLGQQDKSNFISWSNVLLQGSKTNGLSTFDAFDEKSLPQSMGAINKLQLATKVAEEGKIMLAIGERETASLYLGEVQLVGASQNAFVASSPGVIGTVNILKGSFGTINPESVIEYLGLVFWIDVLNGVLVQYSSAGLEPISRYKMSRFFKRYCKDYLDASTGNLDNINGFHHIPMGVDVFHKEVLTTLPGLIYENYAATLPSYSSVPEYATSIINRFDIYDSLAKTMAFQYEENKFGSNFEFMPEMYAYLQNIMFGFKNGLPYTFNTNTTNWNTFFGVEYPVRLCFTGNLNPSLLKVLNNVSIEGNQSIPNFTVAMTNIPNIQVSDLAYYSLSDINDWTNNESILDASFYGDRLDPNQSGTADEKLYTGSSLTDFSIFVMCEWQIYDQLMWVNCINIGYSASKGNNNTINVINR